MISPGAFSSLATLFTGNTMLRIFFASVALVVVTIVLLVHATHHGAHANSPTHCVFWAEIEAGLFCR